MPEEFRKHDLRTPCSKCDGSSGYITRKSHQDVVRCATCDKWQYNAPRDETGEQRVSVSSRRQIKPGQRTRVFNRDGARCVVCGRSAADVGALHIGHLISVKEAPALGLSDDLVWHDENLAVMCDECNLGISADSVSAKMIAVLVTRRGAA